MFNTYNIMVINIFKLNSNTTGDSISFYNLLRVTLKQRDTVVECNHVCYV